MSSPGTGSTNQAQTITAFKRLLGKANTSALKESYEETIPSNIQIDTSTIFGETIPQTVTTSTLYTKFSASASDPVTAEHVEFYLQSIGGTTYDANTGTFGSVGFGAGDESQNSGPHAYQLVLTASYETLSSNSSKSTGYYVNNQIINAGNGGIQLISPSFGPQSGNNYGLELYTAHPDDGGSRIYPTDPMDWNVDYFNGLVFIQDYNASKIPTYARGFLYIGKYANNIITGISGSDANIIIKEEGSNVTTSVSSINFVGASVTATNSGNDVTVTVTDSISYSRRAVTSTITASVSDVILGVTAASALEIRLPSAAGYSSGQYFTVKDEGGNANTNNITILTSESQTIDGVASIILESPYAAVNLYSDGTSKFFIY
jgi:hypothetical protein|tara:strand:+ start:1288 stop:2415 length:1128 start_codon:yes stop_codon:yes gene_type:complete